MADDLLTSLLGTPTNQPVEMLDKILGHEDSIQAGPPMGHVVQPKFQPVNQATMECHRGPCQHFWAVTARNGDYEIGDEIQLKRMRQCNCHAEPLELAEECIYQCGLWWPTFLAWVPESVRPLLRPKLRAAWEWWLRRIGYDFSWRTWHDDIFEADSPERRGNAKPGAPSGAGWRGVNPRAPIGRETADGIHFNS